MPGQMAQSGKNLEFVAQWPLLALKNWMEGNFYTVLAWLLTNTLPKKVKFWKFRLFMFFNRVEHWKNHVMNKVSPYAMQG